MKKLSFSNVEFNKQWEYQNTQGNVYFRVGVIKKSLFYVFLGGKVEESDSYKIEEVIERVIVDGRFKNTSHFRIVDFDKDVKISFFARKHLMKTFRRIYSEYNCNPVLTYFCNAKLWMRPTLVFVERVIELKFSFVNDIQEAFDRINQKGIVCETANSTKINSLQEDIDKVLNLVSSSVWATKEELILDTIATDSPLAGLYHAVEVMVSDKNEILKKERRISEERNRELEQQKLLTNISFEFTKLEKFETKISHLLRLIGQFVKTSRVYVFEDFDDGLFSKKTYEWRNSNVQTERYGLDEISHNDVPSLKKMLIKDKIINSQNISELPQDLQELLKPLGMKSVLIFPIYMRKQFRGFVGFDEYERDRIWDNNEIEFLNTITNIISTAYEQQEVELMLAERESQTKTILETTSEGWWVINKSFETVDVNNSMCQMLGYTREEMMGKTPLEFVDAENAKIFMAQTKHIPGVYNRKYEITLKSKSNTDIFVLVNSTTLYDENNNAIKSFAFVTDITEQKNIQRVLKESEEQTKILLNANTDIVFIVDKFGRHIYFNKQVEKVLGYVHGENIGKSFIKYVPKEEIPKFLKVLKNVFVNSKDVLFSTNILHKSGKLIPVEISVRRIMYRGKKAIFGTIRDISQRIETEKALQLSEKRHNDLLNDLDELVLELDNNGIVVFANNVAESIYKIPISKLLNKPLTTLFEKNSSLVASKAFNKAFLGEIVQYEVTLTTGHIGLFKNTPKRDEAGNIIGVVALGRDITENKEVQRELDASRKQYSILLNNLNDIVFEISLDGKVLFANPIAAEILGKPLEELHNIPFYQLYDKKSQIKIYRAYQKIFKRKEHGQVIDDEVVELELRLKNGKLIFVKTTPIIDADGKLFGHRGIARDITKQKETEKALLESEETLRGLIESSKDWIWAINENGKHTYCSSSIEAILGYKPEELIGKPSNVFMHEDDVEMVMSRIPKYIETKSGWTNLVIRWKHKRGGFRYLESTAVPILIDGKLKGFRGIDRDVTDRKEIETALIESEEKFRILFEKSEDALLVIDNGKIIDCNQSSVNLLGYKTKKEVLNIAPSKISPEKQPDGSISEIKAKEMLEIALKKGSNHFEWVHKKADGKKIPVAVWLTTIPYKDRKIIHVVWRDISEQKQREYEIKQYQNHLEELVNKRTKELVSYQEKLEEMVEKRTLQYQRSEEKHRALLDNSTDAIMRFDRNYRHLYVSPSIKRLTGINPDKFLGKTRGELGFSAKLNEIWHNAIKKVFDTKMKDRLEFELPNHKWIDWSLTPEFDVNGNVTSVLTSARDITERKKDEALLRIKTKELEMFNEAMLNREMRIIELKEEVNRLAEKINLATPYPEIWKDAKGENDE